MIDAWTPVRFFHVLGATVWVDGLVAITLVVLPAVQRVLGMSDRAELLRTVGRRFAVATFTAFLPAQVATGLLLASRHGVTWASLSEPGYGRVLATKVILFAVVMATAAVHGIAQARRQPRAARAASITALTGSVGVLLLATELVEGVAG